MRVHIGVEKQENCLDQVFLGSSFLPQSITSMRNQHLCDVMIVTLQWKKPKPEQRFKERETLSQQDD